jgi:hypothetical protein
VQFFIKGATEHLRHQQSHERRVFPVSAAAATYPAHTAIKMIMDNHSAHISKETNAWLAKQSVGRFQFTFTPTHGSWLNLIGRDRGTARATLGQGLAVSAFPLYARVGGWRGTGRFHPPP